MSQKEKTNLETVRAQIDSIDAQIQNLIAQRAECASEVARVKRESGETSNFYRPEREAQVLQKVMQNNQGPLADSQVAVIFREIMSACLNLQQPLKIAFLGPQGTHTQAAARKHFGHGVEELPMLNTETILHQVESGAADYGVVPVENSTEGVVSNTLDCVMKTNLIINGEVELRINQNLLTKAKSLQDIKCVYSHQQGLAQVRTWLDNNLPNVERIATSSTAEAARLAAEDKTVAAISSATAAEIYEIPVFAACIEDNPNNTTRFLIVGTKALGPSGKDKTSILLASNNEPGGLYKLLEPLANYEVDMTKIESRPSRERVWDYVFFIDIVGHNQDADVKQALEQVEKRASMFKVLGSYPLAVL